MGLQWRVMSELEHAGVQLLVHAEELQRGAQELGAVWLEDFQLDRKAEEFWVSDLQSMGSCELR